MLHFCEDTFEAIQRFNPGEVNLKADITGRIILRTMGEKGVGIFADLQHWSRVGYDASVDNLRQTMSAGTTTEQAASRFARTAGLAGRGLDTDAIETLEVTVRNVSKNVANTASAKADAISRVPQIAGASDCCDSQGCHNMVLWLNPFEFSCRRHKCSLFYVDTEMERSETYSKYEPRQR